MRDRLSSLRSNALWAASRVLDRGRRSALTPWLLCVVTMVYMSALIKLRPVEDLRGAGSEQPLLERSMTAGAERHSESVALRGNRMCILQPVLSPRDQVWNETTTLQHTGLRLFLDSFLRSVDRMEDRDLEFWVYYGHDADDRVFGNERLLRVYAESAQNRARLLGLALRLRFVPLYELHGRITAIWNELAAVAYRDGCNYFFMSNDDMVIYTRGWAAKSVSHLTRQRGGPKCKHFGIVRFKDEWANWAKFTFHVSTRMHMVIFNGVYYAIPFKTTHNDFWIYKIYNQWHADHYDGSIKVRNRVVSDNSQEIAEPRYQYDSKAGISGWVKDGSARIAAWLAAHHHSLVPALCSPAGSPVLPPSLEHKKQLHKKH